MKQLDFTLSLIDKLTRPLKQAQSSVTGFAEKSQAAFGKIAVGGAGLVGVGLSIKGALGPAIEITDALNAAATKGIDETTLQKVAGDALAFSAKYGKSSVDFINSTEAIRSQVGLLTNQELPAFVMATNTLAAATKASGTEAAEYMGSMYNKFSSYAEKIGRVEFAEQVANKTAYMVKAFGTNMQAMSDLMEGARGVGANYGVGIDEQFAVMGQLERTLGSEASSVYESFYQTAQDGAKKLGMSFVNATGGMVSLPEMLEKLQTRYGASIEGNLKAQAALDDAFGDSSVLIKQLYGNVDLLKRHINELGSSDGMKRATEMAERMTNPWERLTAIWYSIRAAMGLTLLPVLYPLINKMADAGQTLVRWLKLFPNLARAIGLAVLAFLGLAAAGAIANIVLGVMQFIIIGLSALWTGFTAILKIHVAAIWLYKKAALAWAAAMRILRVGLLALRMASVMAGIAFNFMSWPILLIIGALVLLGVGCYLLIKHWDAIKAALMQTDAFKNIAAVVSWVGEIFAGVWAWVADGWDQLCAYFKGFSLADSFEGMVDAVGSLFSGLWDSVKKVFASTYNWIIDKLNVLPGVNLDTMTMEVVPTVVEPQGMPDGVQSVKIPAIDPSALPTALATVAERGILPEMEHVSAIAPATVPQPAPELMAAESVRKPLMPNVRDPIVVPKVLQETTSTRMPAPELMPASGARKALLQDVRDPIVVPRAMQGMAATPAPAVPAVKVPQPSPQQVQVLAQVQSEKSAPPPPAPSMLLSGGKLKGIGPGGINKEINNNSRTVTDNRKNIENVHINVKQGMTPEQLMEWQELS
ncbi:phage tail tape measure protein [Serratia proteamaculans]|uniref:phage tail tape measure protein n=1 Tax=Serratia proteamaculans TaxID=28151 RepID=UPI0021828815|nr:phage tail tape measure protein [Serratia proteamaculans]CAI2439348.1 phage tail tape measure protein, TP901 family, core region [Serratia proteamaculans]